MKEEKIHFLSPNKKITSKCAFFFSIPNLIKDIVPSKW